MHTTVKKLIEELDQAVDPGIETERAQVKEVEERLLDDVERAISRVRELGGDARSPGYVRQLSERVKACFDYFGYHNMQNWRQQVQPPA